MVEGMILDAKQLINKYLNAEFKTWRLVHKTRDDEKAEEVIRYFERNYFSADMSSIISRPGNMNDLEFSEFSQLISEKSKRHIFCALEIEPNRYLAVLGSEYYGKDVRFEIVYYKAESDEPVILSSYLSDFDGTFSYSAGEDLGEYLHDPCSESEAHRKI